MKQCRELPALMAKSFAVRKRTYVYREQNKYWLGFGVKHWLTKVKQEQLPSLGVLLCSFVVLPPLPPAPMVLGCRYNCWIKTSNRHWRAALRKMAKRQPLVLPTGVPSLASTAAR